MEAIAHARFARFAPRKVGRVLGLVRGKTIGEAVGILEHVPQRPARFIKKTVLSAFANLNSRGGESEQNKVRIVQAFANQGPTMKRIRAMAMGGRATYKRKICHLTVVVSDKQ